MTQPVTNRSEIVFLIDAQDCNPNGNPMGENRPRIDPVTGHAAITDVRLKRYLRDQLQADGHPIFIQKTLDGADGAQTRAKLALDRLGEIESPDEIADIEDIADSFLEAAVDVRYFGATLSFQKNTDDELYEAVREHFPSQFTGPVQFAPARSLNTVEETDAISSLTTVVATKETNQQGGYRLTDNRIKYGIFPFHGLIDENGAQDTNLSVTDVKRLDSLCWRAIKNQTITRSKIGQEPRLYLRVEYATPGYHEGDLQTGITLDSAHSHPDSELRNVRDVCLNITPLVTQLVKAHEAGHIQTIHLVGNDRLTLTIDGEQLDANSLSERLTAEGLPVREISVFEEFSETLPT